MRGLRQSIIVGPQRVAAMVMSAGEVQRIPLAQAEARDAIWTPDKENPPGETKLWTPDQQQSEGART